MRGERWSPSGAIVCLLLVATCSEGRDGEGATDQPQRNVLVIDQGIDLTAADLRGKVVASFTRECDDQTLDGGSDPDDAGTGAPDGGAPMSFEKLKREFIAEYLTRDESCRLRPGIDDKADPLAGVQRYRDRWNAMLRGSQTIEQAFSQTEADELNAAFEVAFRTTMFHGTGTAGTVAHANPGVRLILVETRLGSSQSFRDTFQCIAQEDVDRGVALLRDPEVRDAYVHAPVSRYAEALTQVIAQYRVGVVNLSYSSWTRAALEQLQLEKGCAPVDLSGYFAAFGELGSAWRAQNGALPYVSVQAAGNEGLPLDAPADANDCTPGSDRRLFVGSYGLTEARSAFSNHGACVDVFAPGESIVVAYAQGWLLPASGTSYAAPLVAWQLSRMNLSPFDPAEARRRLLSQRNADGNIPLATFPTDFFHNVPAASHARRGALTAGVSPGPHPPRLLPVLPVDWNAEVLRPLRRLTQPEARRRPIGG